MPRNTISVVVLLLGLLAAPAAGAQDWSGALKGAADAALGSKQGVAGLSTQEMSSGLKEALAVGAERAIRGLGRSGGYLDDAKVRIPLPGKLKDLEGTLRMLGQGAAVDEFTTTVNRAAEQAIPKAAPIVGDAIRGMSIADAKRILTGPDDAATRYFRDKSSAALIEAMLPVVRGATDKAGVTRAYKDMIGKAGPAGAMLGSSVDVDRYVTEEALDGLFLKLAEQEKRIRSNPAARSTDLLKKVFGAAQR
jgi:hypothetical protein